MFLLNRRDQLGVKVFPCVSGCVGGCVGGCGGGNDVEFTYESVCTANPNALEKTTAREGSFRHWLLHLKKVELETATSSRRVQSHKYKFVTTTTNDLVSCIL